MGYANPDAVTQIANGLSTSTFSYDNNGNLAQKTTDGVTTTYLYDYANRLTALGSQGATTTYGYDAFGSRVFQSTATTHHAVSLQVVLRGELDGHRGQVRHDYRVRLQWRFPRLDGGLANR